MRHELLPRIALVTAAITLGTFGVTLLIVGAPQEIVGQAAMRGGACFTAATAFWAIYEKWGWRWRGFRLGGWLSPYPDLNGRWEGTVCRDGGDVPHPFVVEIRQTYSRISFRTFSEHSRGESEFAHFKPDGSGAVLSLVATWITTTTSLVDPDNKDTFRGTSQWDIVYDDKPGDRNDSMRIVDTYYTVRVPRTSGQIDVRRTSRKLKNSFC